jgi:hypothetical protein
MTSEKMYQKVLDIVSLLSVSDRKVFEDFMKRPEKFEHCDLVPIALSNLAKEIKADMLTESAKKCGKNEAKKSADRIIKEMDSNPAMTTRAGAFVEGEYQYIGCGNLCVRTKDHISVYKTLPDRVEHLPFKRFIDDISKNDGEKLNLPSIAELKTYIKTKKAEKEKYILWDFGENLPQVDTKYLLDILVIMGECEATASKHRPMTTGIYLVNDRAEAILMPVRKEGR